MRAVSEKQIQEAVDAHTGTQLLQIVLTGSVRLVKGITLRKGTGPLKLSASKAPAADAEGIPKPSVVLDASRIKPAAPALTVFSTAALQIDGLAITGCKGAPAIYARQSGPLTISASLLKDNNNTGGVVVAVLCAAVEGSAAFQYFPARLCLYTCTTATCRTYLC